jgi:hypothetical protein
VPQEASQPTQPADLDRAESRADDKKPARRCCGLPLWAFILVLILIFAAIAVAIVIPLQFFVFKTLGNQSTADQSQGKCESSLVCQNGGTKVVSQGVCSCICTNGFSGRDCTGARSDACTTTDLVSSVADRNIDDVTLGTAIPRLIVAASANFSVPLSGTIVLAKLNSGDLSCIAQNSLVTFNGQSTRIGNGGAAVQDVGEGGASLDPAAAPISVITLQPGETVTVHPPKEDEKSSTTVTSAPPTTTTKPPSERTTSSMPPSEILPSSTGADSPAPSPSPSLITAFAITEEMLDFGRVAVLYALQEQNTEAAVAAQTSIQRFISEVQRDGERDGANKRAEAADLSIGGNNRLDLINLTVDVGKGRVGPNVEKRAASVLFIEHTQNRRGGSSLPKQR